MTSHYHQKMQGIFKQYQEEVSTDPVDLKEVGAWAMAKGLWAPRPVDIQNRFAAEMAEALGEEYRTDKAGRRYRSKLAVTNRQGSLWGDMDTSPRSHVAKNVQQRRRVIVGHCYQVQVDVDHYNDDHPDQDPLQTVMNFEDDVAEMMVAAGIARKDDAA
jgi:hypothetical protein